MVSNWSEGRFVAPNNPSRTAPRNSNTRWLIAVTVIFDICEWVATFVRSLLQGSG